MYKILGADQKEYGPVSADQVRQWIAERRLHGLSLAQVEGTTEWKGLSQFPEFAAALASGSAEAIQPEPLAPAAPLRASMSTELPRTNGMAMAGLITGILSVTIGWCCCFFGIPFGLLGVIFSLLGLSQINKNPHLERGRGMAIAGLILSIIGLLLVALLNALGLVMNWDQVRREIKW